MVECNNKACANCVKNECATTPKIEEYRLPNKAIVYCQKFTHRRKDLEGMR